MKLYGVQFNKENYHAVKKSLESVKIEGFKPTNKSVKDIKKLLDGDLLIKDLAEKHKLKTKRSGLK